MKWAHDYPLTRAFPHTVPERGSPSAECGVTQHVPASTWFKGISDREKELQEPSKACVAPNSDTQLSATASCGPRSHDVLCALVLRDACLTVEPSGNQEARPPLLIRVPVCFLLMSVSILRNPHTLC